MAIGDITINSFTVGGLNLTDDQSAHLVGFNVYEDILNPFGPIVEARVLDYTDALGKNDFNGSEEVQISFSSGQGNSRTFKFKLAANKNLNDGTVDKSGSGKAKQYNLRMVSEEMIKAQQKHVQKTYKEKPTSDAIKDIVKQFSNKDVETEETTKQRLQFDREHPVDAIKKVYGRSVSTQNKSSLFMLYQTGEGGEQKYRFETWEKAFGRSSSSLKFKQDLTIASKPANEEDQKQNLLWFKVSDSFKSVTRGLGKSSETTYNRETGVAHRVKEDPQDNFKVAGNPVYKKSNSGSDKPDQKPPVFTMHSPSNEKSDPKLSEARANRAAFLSHLAQNSAEFECIGNSELTVGKMIDLDIPNKSQDGSGANEKQFSGKALIVAVRHKIKPLGQTPRYTCIVRVVKAAYDQGGGKEA